MATPANTAADRTKDQGSSGANPYSIFSASRKTASASAAPAANPATTSPPASRRTSAAMRGRFAPSAMRMPISCVRRATEGHHTIQPDGEKPQRQRSECAAEGRHQAILLQGIVHLCVEVEKLVGDFRTRFAHHVAYRGHERRQRLARPVVRKDPDVVPVSVHAILRGGQIDRKS